MSNETTHVNNPFPAEAVTTFGAARITYDKLQYMTDVNQELQRYLAAYPRDDLRYGGAVGLSGGYGSGKTHVLSWVAEMSRGTKTIRSTVAYVKCDSSKVFDLYQQLMQQIDRPLIIELIQLALLRLARSKAREAKATESLAERLETAGSLLVLQSEQNLDLEDIRQQLLVELRALGGQSELSRLLLDVSDATLGVDAYRWLSGNDVLNRTDQSLNDRLGSWSGNGAVESETNAIIVLEMIAALHRLAGVPLIVLVDQLEVLIRTSVESEFDTLGSLIKKFVEHLGRQAAVVFIAGVPAAWARLPRDVPARFRGREPIAVGGLSLNETRALLGAYGNRKGVKSFEEAAIGKIFELSGGNPREVLRISHRAFELTKGDLARVDQQVLLYSARQAGSLEDRVGLVLSTVDSLLSEFGGFSRERVIADGIVVDRTLNGSAGEVITALAIVKATDPLEEIDSVRRLQEIRRYRDEHWQRAQLVVVALGYSTAEVRSLLGPDVVAIVYDEKAFEGELRGRLAADVSRIMKASVLAGERSTLRSDAEVAKSLSEISTRLQQLEQQRVMEAVRIQERFVAQTEKLAKRPMEERVLASRREVLDAIDVLADRLLGDDPDGEQKLVRAILVANEVHLRNVLLDDIGEAYLDLLLRERWMPKRTLPAREELITEMRRSLRLPSGAGALLLHTRTVVIVAVSFCVLFVATGILSASRVSERRVAFLPYPRDFISVLPFVFLIGVAGLAYIWMLVWFVSRARLQAQRRRVNELRGKERDEGSLVSRYPQT